MAVLPIAHLGHPVLREIARPVDLGALGASGPNELQQLVDDLIDTMRDEGGVGIAAPQVGRSLQIAVLECLSSDRYKEADPIPLMVLVNPVITHYSDEKTSFWEGCLSLKDLRGLVSRSLRVTVDAWSRTGEPLHIEAEGFLAIVLQHELDHLQGKLFIDRMEDLKQLVFLDEFEKYWAPQEEAAATEGPE